MFVVTASVRLALSHASYSSAILIVGAEVISLRSSAVGAQCALHINRGFQCHRVSETTLYLVRQRSSPVALSGTTFHLYFCSRR